MYLIDRKALIGGRPGEEEALCSGVLAREPEGDFVRAGEGPSGATAAFSYRVDISFREE